MIFPLIFLSLFFKSCLSIMYIRQNNFNYGTLIIDKPGKYILMENITFSPNPAINGDAYNSNWPTKDQMDSYNNPNQFRLGFFAAICIKTKDIEIDLNGYTIEQSKENALLQRFFSIIELAELPFLPSQGPHSFGSTIKFCSNIKIHNGRLGRSSHHGIHGNGPSNVILKNLIIDDFEVAAIAINGGDTITIDNCIIGPNRKDLPVYGTFSSARFIQRYIDHLYLKEPKAKTILKINNIIYNIDDIRDELMDSINNVYEDVIVDSINTGGYIDTNKHPNEFRLYHNNETIIDGNAYGILLNKIGVAVNGFPNRTNSITERSSNNIIIKNTIIKNLDANIREIIALTNNGGGAMIDPIGSVFQIFNIDTITGEPITVTSFDPNKAKYIGNVIADAQLFVTKAILEGEFCGSIDEFSIKRSSISQDIIDWSESDKTLDNINFKREDFRCNGDSMFHVNKGLIALKIDNTIDSNIKDINIQNIKNIGNDGNNICGNIESYFSHPKATNFGYNGDDVYGITLAGSKNVNIENISINNIISLNGEVRGLDILTDSILNVANNINIDFLTSTSKSYTNTNVIGVNLKEFTKDNIITNCCVKNLYGITTLNTSNSGIGNSLFNFNC